MSFFSRELDGLLPLLLLLHLSYHRWDIPLLCLYTPVCYFRTILNKCRSRVAGNTSFPSRDDGFIEEDFIC